MALGVELSATDRRRARRQATIAEILDAAWVVAREQGIAGITLKDVAARVGMRPPSLYEYFASKDALYDALFRQGTQEALDRLRTIEFPPEPEQALRLNAREFIDFCTEDGARYQLMFQRVIPGFEPSPESWELALEAYDVSMRPVRALGVGQRELDLWTGIISGLLVQQHSNEPGGDRWVGLLDEVVDMYLDHIRNRSTRRGKR